MSGQLFVFTDGSHVEFGPGKFDDWCVYHVAGNGSRVPPKDIDYFATLRVCETSTDSATIYRDFVEVYDRTRKEPEVEVFELIRKHAAGYADHSLSYEQAMTFIYLGMIAEENKQFTKLGKRIKRLGLHKLLIERKSVEHSANFMKGMNWRDIDQLCRERDF